MSAHVFEAGSRAQRAWLSHRLTRALPWLLFSGRLSKRKARKWRLIPDPYRDRSKF